MTIKAKRRVDAAATDGVTWIDRFAAMLRAAHDPSLLKGEEPPPPKQRDALRKIDLAKRAYDEVLDATKHQDDKVGRFLTAIAFLTTGAIALIATGAGLRREFSIPEGGDHPLLAWSTGGFFALTLAAVVLLLLCLSVPVRLPRTSDDPMKMSHLFYSYIATRPRDEWVQYWKSAKSRKLESAIAEDYSREAHNLAERASAKYRHSYEASWLFVCALLFLGVSIYLKLIALFRADAQVAVELQTRHLVGLALIASFHAALQIYTRAVHDIRSMEKARDHARAHKKSTVDPDDEAPDEGFIRNSAMYGQRRWTFALVISTTAYSVTLAMPLESWRWGRLSGVAVVFFATLVPLLLTRPIWNNKRKAKLRRWDWRSWRVAVGAAAIAAVSVWAAVCNGGVWRVIAIVLPPFLMSVINASRPAYSHWVARQLQRRHAAPTFATASPTGVADGLRY